MEASDGALTKIDIVVISLHVKAREVELQTFCVIAALSEPVALAIGRRVRDVERGAAPGSALVGTWLWSVSLAGLVAIAVRVHVAATVTREVP